MMLKLISGAVVGLAIMSCAAGATTIDFTNAATGKTGTIGSITWTMTSNIGTPNNSQLFDGQGSNLTGTGLALQRDGYGVRSAIDNSRKDDEITSMRGGMEAITLTFSKAVNVTAVSFLDLYLTYAGGIGEVGYALFDDGTSVSASATDIANSHGSRRAGYASTAFSAIKTTTIRFFIGLTNDQQGLADGALASVDVAPVPVPGAGLLLLGGLGGLAVVRRARRA
jgi:hypothetical protein